MFKGTESLQNPEILLMNLKMCNIGDEQIENGKLLSKVKSKPNLNLFFSKFVFARDMLKAFPYMVFNQLWAKFVFKHK